MRSLRDLDRFFRSQHAYDQTDELNGSQSKNEKKNRLRGCRSLSR